MPIFAIIGKDANNKNLNKPKYKFFQESLCDLKVKILLIKQFEVAAKITPIGKTFSKSKAVIQIKKYITNICTNTPIKPIKTKLKALLGIILPKKL